jgi:hypothetical protein
MTGLGEPSDAGQSLTLAQKLFQEGWITESEADAVGSNYQRAWHLDDPSSRTARRNLATLLVQAGRREESFGLWYVELLSGAEGLAWMNDLVSTAMRSRDLRLAGEYAAILASLRWGSQWYPAHNNSSHPLAPVQAPAAWLTISKLRHDIEQFVYLQSRGILGDEFTTIIRDYQGVIDRLTRLDIVGRVPMENEDHSNIGHVYNRIVHVRDTPRVGRALSGKWDAAVVEEQYLKPPGIVIVDEFLSAEALEGVRAFCLESTVWSGTRYAHGRLGAFFRDGFNCPLLLQIAEELREALPQVIGDRYPLRQLWGFKNGENLPADSTTHADFASVNVNFWVTPDDANLDKTSGGLVVYGVDAPIHWNFEIYNCRPDIIKSFIQQQGAQAIKVRYRQNRAVIFNSDLFHGTAALHFRSGYENRRVNITMLYGDREDDVHHRNLARRDSIDAANSQRAAWRSAAFERARMKQH